MLISPRRGRALPAIAAAVAAAVIGLPLAVHGQQPGDDEAPPVTVAPPLESGVEVVHSWALAPAGSADPSEAGNRPNLSYTADPGATIDDAVTLFNFGNATLTFRVYGTDAFNADSGALDLLAGDVAPDGVGSWIGLAQQAVTVAPGQQATIPFTLTVPDGARPGDHTGAILASSEAVGTGEDGNTVTLDRRTGTRLLLRVNGPITPELAIEDIATDYSPALNPLAGSASVTYRIVNTGNVRLDGNSSLSVGGPFGIGEQKVPPLDFTELLPGEDIVVTAEVDDVPAFGLAVTEIAVTPAESGDDVVLDTVARSSTVFAPPIALLLLLLAAMFGLLALRAVRRHRDVDQSSADSRHEREHQLT